MVSATAMDAGVPAMWGRLVMDRWNAEIDSVESWLANAPSALRSATNARLEKPSRASEIDCHPHPDATRNATATPAAVQRLRIISVTILYHPILMYS